MKKDETILVVSNNPIIDRLNQIISELQSSNTKLREALSQIKEIYELDKAPPHILLDDCYEIAKEALETEREG